MGSEQLGLVGVVPAHGRGIGTELFHLKPFYDSEFSKEVLVLILIHPRLFSSYSNLGREDFVDED